MGLYQYIEFLYLVLRHGAQDTGDVASLYDETNSLPAIESPLTSNYFEDIFGF